MCSTGGIFVTHKEAQEVYELQFWQVHIQWTYNLNQTYIGRSYSNILGIIPVCYLHLVYIAYPLGKSFWGQM